MIFYLLASLFTAATLSAFVSLTDSGLRLRNAFIGLQRERSLADAGFVPHLEATEVRLRPAAPSYRGSATRPFARRLPNRLSALQDVAAA